mmetsp:Transcript_2071/g.4582  ORF Transcript_2071/g.4582 Transcript_2071/m.4582 type:complete len:224 (-) Transcript_2071:798-1469(-)
MECARGPGWALVVFAVVAGAFHGAPLEMNVVDRQFQPQVIVVTIPPVPTQSGTAASGRPPPRMASPSVAPSFDNGDDNGDNGNDDGANRDDGRDWDYKRNKKDNEQPSPTAAVLPTLRPTPRPKSQPIIIVIQKQPEQTPIATALPAARTPPPRPAARPRKRSKKSRARPRKVTLPRLKLHPSFYKGKKRPTPRPYHREPHTRYRTVYQEKLPPEQVQSVEFF